MTPLRKVAFVSAGWTIWEHRLLSGALRYADTHPRIVIRVFAPAHSLSEAAQQAEAWGASGTIGLTEHADLQQYLGGLKRPIPFVNCALAREQPGVVSVLGDFSAFVEAATGHLRQLGLRSLALFVPEQGPTIHERLVQPFLRLARAAESSKAALVLAVGRKVLWDPHTRVTPVPARLKAWLQDLPKPVGVICPTVGGGGYLIRCCHAVSLRVPEDVAVVGADETDLSLASQPTLTSVLLSVETLGSEGMRVLADMMTGIKPPSPIVRIKCLDLNVRESTGRRRPEICDIAGALACIREQASRGLTVQQVIRQTQNVSRVTFHRRFLEVVGKTPAEAIREQKLAEVRRLLVGTELPLNMVADLAGFSSSQILARSFRLAEGLTPTDFRRRHQLLPVQRRMRGQTAGPVEAKGRT